MLDGIPMSSSFRLRRRAWMAVLVLQALFCNCSPAQEDPAQEPPSQNGEPAGVNVTSGPGELVPAASGSRASLHGIVKNAATGQPLARALVRIEGDAANGALTDGEGRFEISSVPLGPQAVQVMKPGFIDTASAGLGPPSVVNGSSNSEHNVNVTASMPDLVFSLAPTNAIVGQVSLSTGDPAQGIAVMLLRRSVQDGRAVWQPVTNVRTNSDGAFRFAGLTDGEYTVFTEPAMDSDIAGMSAGPGGDSAVERAGYRSIFYPDAPELTGASSIKVSAGQQAQANLLLTEEPFHLVRAAVTLPRDGNPDPQMNVNVAVLDAQGRQMAYSGQYDQATHSVQAFLPDGNYVFQVTVMAGAAPAHFEPSRVAFPRAGGRQMSDTHSEAPLIGRADFSVAGHDLKHLRIPLTVQRSSPIDVSVIRSGIASPRETSTAPIVVMISQAGGSINDGMVASFAEGYPVGPIESNSNTTPGSYWVHTSIPQKWLCEASFTAGGASLAREPLVLSPSGATAPLALTLRDDCATLKIALPDSADFQQAGDEPYYTVYVVPDFDSTTDITPVVLRPSSGGSITLEGLTPGAYHVYTFTSAVQLEYRNPEAMAAYSSHSQPVSLDPGGTANLVVGVPEP